MIRLSAVRLVIKPEKVIVPIWSVLLVDIKGLQNNLF